MRNEGVNGGLWALVARKVVICLSGAVARWAGSLVTHLAVFVQLDFVARARDKALSVASSRAWMAPPCAGHQQQGSHQASRPCLDLLCWHVGDALCCERLPAASVAVCALGIRDVSAYVTDGCDDGRHV